MLLVKEIRIAESGSQRSWDLSTALEFRESLSFPTASDLEEDNLPSQGGAWMTRADWEE